MDRKEIVCLNKIREHAAKTLLYCKDIDSAAEFSDNQQVSDACAFNLLQIGELTKTGLSETTKHQLNNIPWPEIQGLRNRIVHGYDGVRMNIIFETIKSDLPQLVSDIDEVLTK